MSTKSKKGQPEALRFAHPYFTPTPVNERGRMLDHIKGTLHPIPALKGDGKMNLADIIGKSGEQAILASGKIIMHLAGDTGVPEIDHETRQVMVADAMAMDYNAADPAGSPAFFLHLGDVIYGPNPNSFLDQFYRPYMHYPGKIIAIPGNHDGESIEKMAAFQKYFCAATATVPPIAGSIFRQTMTQPGVFWFLDAPFVQIIGLYSNSAENPGFISGATPGQEQKQWLVETLKAVKASRPGNGRKALLFATHHPPYSSGGHSGSTEMLADIDDACNQAGIMPDAFFSGHAHSIQRYTRSVAFGGKTLSIPYIVSGCGGHGDQNVASPKSGGNPTYDFAYKGWGYTRIEVTSQALGIKSFSVDWDSTQKPITKQIDAPRPFPLVN
jgi:Calcineurin-like phosphoesterase